VASTSRAHSGDETLQYFAELQRTVADRAAPLRIRQRQRRRQRARRLIARTLLVLLPILLAGLVALDAAGSRTWLGDRWGDLTRSSTGESQTPAG
jgi:hypothetical protein